MQPGERPRAPTSRLCGPASKSTDMLRILAGIALLLSMSACQAPRVPGNSQPQPGAGSASGNGSRTLELADAVALSATLDLRSAVALASARPAPRREVKHLVVEHTTAETSAPLRSVMRFARLPNGLRHVVHDVPASPGHSALHETFVDAYGVASVLYWNSRFEGGMPAPEPSRVRLVSGKLYSLDTAYVIEQTMEDGLVITTSCSPEAAFPASSIHETFSGLAAVFNCTASTDVTERVWYFADAALYVVSEWSSDGELMSRFRIVEVMFAGPRAE